MLASQTHVGAGGRALPVAHGFTLQTLCSAFITSTHNLQIQFFYQIFKPKQTHVALTVKNCCINRDIPVSSLLAIAKTGTD